MIKNDKSIKGQMESLENEMSRYNTELKICRYRNVWNTKKQ